MRALPIIFILGLQAATADAASVTIDRRSPSIAVIDQILGMNMANWFDPTQAGMATALKTGGIASLRWPGGSASDTFHWQTNSECNGGYVDGHAIFDNFFSKIVLQHSPDVAVTVNYGSNAACAGGGDPAEAASWVVYAKTHGDKVSHWTVGNEVYGSWEYDLHATPHDAATVGQRRIRHEAGRTEGGRQRIARIGSANMSRHRAFRALGVVGIAEIRDQPLIGGDPGFVGRRRDWLRIEGRNIRPVPLDLLNIVPGRRDRERNAGGPAPDHLGADRRVGRLGGQRRVDDAQQRGLLL